MPKELTYERLLIETRITQELYKHKEEPNPQLYVNTETQTLSYLDGEPICATHALNYIHEWVAESLEKYGKVVLYTCKDNLEIGIEDPSDITEEELSYTDQPYGLGNFFICYD